MNVKDFLAGVGVAICHEPVSAFFHPEYCGDLGYGGENFAYDDAVVGMNVIEGGDVFFGDDENVLGRGRMNVLEGNTHIVFINSFGRDLSIDDFTEKTLGHDYHLRSSGVSRLARVSQLLLVGLFAVMFFPACASVTQPKSNDLRAVVERFHHNLRWKYNEDASVRVVPKYSADFRDRLENLKKDLSITSWKTRKVTVSDDRKTAEVKVYLKFFLMPSTVVREIKLDEVWKLLNGGWFVSEIKGGPFSFPPDPSNEEKPGASVQLHSSQGDSLPSKGGVREISDDDPDG